MSTTNLPLQISKIIKLTNEISQLVEIDNIEYSHITFPVLFPRNIQKILLGLTLKGTSYISVTFNPKTQVKTLSDKWFSLREENNQVVSSLWDSGEEGQIQVLEEFLEVLKGIK